MDADFIIIRNMKQGKEEAFDLFIHKYYGDILKYCTWHCMDLGYAEDYTQETFLSFFTKLSDYHHVGKAKNYLYTIAGNLCKNHYKMKKEVSLEENYLIEKEIPVENLEKVVIDRLLIEDVIQQLSEEQKEVIALYYFQELKVAEIADVLQIGVPLVKYRLRKAKMQMEELLRKGEVEYELRCKNKTV